MMNPDDSTTMIEFSPMRSQVKTSLGDDFILVAPPTDVPSSISLSQAQSSGDPVVPMFNPSSLPHSQPLLPPLVSGNAGNESSSATLTQSQTQSQLQSQSQSQQSTLHQAASQQPQQQRIAVPSLSFHWFFKHESGGWVPFSKVDSARLEELYIAHSKETLTLSPILRTDGGRFDVNIATRKRIPVYWNRQPDDVRRSSWYYGIGDDFQPIPEYRAQLIEAAFCKGFSNKSWPQQIEFEDGDSVVLRNESLFLYYTLESLQLNEPIPRVIRRNYNEIIEQGENVEQMIDHIVLIVPGILPVSLPLSSLGFVHSASRIGSFIDCVDNMRFLSRELMASHFEVSSTSSSSGRVEFLPVDWTSNIQQSLSINKSTMSNMKNLRKFMNDALFESTVYFGNPQQQITAISQSINQIMKVFLSRNPHFSGKIAIVGHGFGGCLLYEMLQHQNEAIQEKIQPSSLSSLSTNNISVDFTAVTQSLENLKISKPITTDDDVTETATASTTSAVIDIDIATFLREIGLDDLISKFLSEEVTMETLLTLNDNDFKDLGVTMGKKKKITAALTRYQTRAEEISMESKRRQMEAEIAEKAEKIESQIQLTTKEIQSQLQGVLDQLKAEKERKQSIEYSVLNLKPSFVVLLGSPLGLCLSLSDRIELSETTKLPTCAHVINVFHPYDPLAYRLDHRLLDTPTSPFLIPHHQGRKRIHLELKGYVQQASKDLTNEVKAFANSAWGSINKLLKSQFASDNNNNNNDNAQQQQAQSTSSTQIAQPTQSEQQQQDFVEVSNISFGQLNSGAQIDHVLQEDPFEAINEHLYSLQSHSSYWKSEDTILLLLNKLYLEK